MWHNSAKFWGLPGVVVLWLMISAGAPLKLARGAEGRPEPDPQRGYELLVGKAYLPPDFDTEVFDQLWKVWEKPWREKAAAASPQRSRTFVNCSAAFSKFRPGVVGQWICRSQSKRCWCRGGPARPVAPQVLALSTL